MTPAPSTPAARVLWVLVPPLGESSGQSCLEPPGNSGVRWGGDNQVRGCVPGLLATHALVPRVTRCSVALVYVGMEFGKKKSNPTLKESAGRRGRLWEGFEKSSKKCKHGSSSPSGGQRGSLGRPLARCTPAPASDAGYLVPAPVPSLVVPG